MKLDYQYTVQKGIPTLPLDCPQCGETIAGPHTTGINFVNVACALYRCANCGCQASCKYNVKSPEKRLMLNIEHSKRRRYAKKESYKPLF